MFYSECVPLEEVPRTSRGSWAWNPDSRFPFPVSQKTHSWFVVVSSWPRGRSGIRSISYLLKHAVFLGFLISCHPVLIQDTASRIWIPVSKYRKTGTFCIFVSAARSGKTSHKKPSFLGFFKSIGGAWWNSVLKHAVTGDFFRARPAHKKQVQPVEFYWQQHMLLYTRVVILTLTFII